MYNINNFFNLHFATLIINNYFFLFNCCTCVIAVSSRAKPLLKFLSCTERLKSAPDRADSLRKRHFRHNYRFKIVFYQTLP
jgi:hypothetical protein